jgi:hypothetical protein
MIVNPGTNPNIKNSVLTDSLIDNITSRIKNDFDNLDPKIRYEILTLSTNGSNKYIEVDVYDREFLLSVWFTNYLTNLQEKFLWPLGVYNTIFIYKDTNG